MKNNKNYCTVYIVRHGETEWNAKGLLQGHSDSPLTENGISQAKSLGERLRNITFDTVFSSDLSRAKRTAEIIVQEKNLAVITSRLLRERNYGKFEGKEYKYLDQELKKYSKMLHSQSSYKEVLNHPEIESDESLIGRFITFLREVSIANPNKTVLLVTHGGMIKKLLTHLSFYTKEQIKKGKIQNGCYVKIKSDGIDFFVKETYGITVT